MAFHLNGDRIAGIVKPRTERRYSFINMIPLYLSEKVRNILILMDQEDEQLTAIYERIEKDLEKLATGEIEILKEETTERVRVYKGNYGGKEFELVLVINGLDEIGVGKHSIEDHLLKAAGEVSIEVGDFGNAKDAWRTLSSDQQLSIYKVLKDHRKLLESVFPQQVLGCQHIE